MKKILSECAGGGQTAVCEMETAVDAEQEEAAMRCALLLCSVCYNDDVGRALKLPLGRPTIGGTWPGAGCHW